MATIKILNHGVKYNANERLIYFSPIQLNPAGNVISSLYDDSGEEELASITISEPLIGATTFKRFISDETKTIISMDFDYGESRELSVVLDSVTGLVKGDVMYFNITGGDVTSANYSINDAAFIIKSITGDTVYMSLHYDIVDSEVDKYSIGTSMVGTLNKPYSNFPVSSSKLNKVTNSETVDLQTHLEFYIKQITSNTNGYNGVLVYSSEIVGSNLDLTPEESIYEFTENGYMYSNGISIQNHVTRVGKLKPAMLVKFDDYTFEYGQRINVSTVMADDQLVVPAQSSYDGYIGNMIRMAEDLVNKGLGDIWASVIGLDRNRDIYEAETVDYDKIENYIDSYLSIQNSTNTFDEIFVTDRINLGSDVGIFADDSKVFFESGDGIFGFEINSGNLDYDRIIFDNDVILQFNDNVEVNNTFEIKYSSSLDNVRSNTLVESRMGFFKVKLSNNTADVVADNKIKYFYTIGSQEDRDNRILFSSYIWHNNDISSLGYFSHRNINNFNTFNNFISGKNTSVTVSQGLKRVGIISQEDIYMYSKKNINMLSDKVTISGTDEIIISSKKVTYDVDEIGFKVESLNLLNVNANNFSANKKVSTVDLSASSKITTKDLSASGISDLTGGASIGGTTAMETATFSATATFNSDAVFNGANIKFSALPTAEPTGAGVLWMNAGVLSLTT